MSGVPSVLPGLLFLWTAKPSPAATRSCTSHRPSMKNASAGIRANELTNSWISLADGRLRTIGIAMGRRHGSARAGKRLIRAALSFLRRVEPRRGARRRVHPTTTPRPLSKVDFGNPRTFDPAVLRGQSADDIRAAIPSNWVPRPSKRGGGTVFTDPNNFGRQIRIMPGYTAGNRPDPLTHGPYAEVSQNGVTTKVPLHGNPTLSGGP
jgi:hypothetical protein